jgi:hypothetical protein
MAMSLVCKRQINLLIAEAGVRPGSNRTKHPTSTGTSLILYKYTYLSVDFESGDNLNGDIFEDSGA